MAVSCGSNFKEIFSDKLCRNVQQFKKNCNLCSTHALKMASCKQRKLRWPFLQPYLGEWRTAEDPVPWQPSPACDYCYYFVVVVVYCYIFSCSGCTQPQTKPSWHVLVLQHACSGTRRSASSNNSKSRYIMNKTALENAKHQQTVLFANKVLRQIFRPERGRNRQIQKIT